MPIDEKFLTRLADDLDRLPKRRKSYSKKQAVAAVADKIFSLLRRGCSFDIIYWKVEREFRISKDEFKTTLLSVLQAERPDEAPESVLAEIISEGCPTVDTTATPCGLEQPNSATHALPEPEEAQQKQAVQENPTTNPVAENVNSEPEPAEVSPSSPTGDRIHIQKRSI
ncbi:MAG: hypothetical protein K6E40_02160 [Desulfovibrio sp.]|nr:hypothetical protein [Desulfovibrio sp.]